MESITDALVECVKACGGSKVVGAKLFPEKAPDAAQRHLLDCLNDDRPQQLNPAQVMLILHLARERGFHVGMEYLCLALNYVAPRPIEPEDERAKLQREFIEASKHMARLAERIERTSSPSIRSVA